MNPEPLVVSLSTRKDIPLSLVGGKAASLIRLQNSGFNVPEGIVLTTDFFASWLADIQSSNEWHSVISMMGEFSTRPNLQQRTELEEACGKIKSLASDLPWDAGQQAQILAAASEIGESTCAVRSSSPEEDLSGTSFAGLYETVLDVDSPSIAEAVRKCFCSCLDARVLLYKLEMNFTNLSPSIAVIIQRLVVGDISGVAFTVNPLTNDYDEVLINASWGLGEALVRYAVGRNRQHGILVGYRYKDGELRDSGVEEDYTWKGPIAGFNFRF